MAKPNVINEVAVLTQAIIVRSNAALVRSSASRVAASWVEAGFAAVSGIKSSAPFTA
jgi:hypothetical protein